MRTFHRLSKQRLSIGNSARRHCCYCRRDQMAELRPNDRKKKQKKMGTKAHVKWVYTERLWLHTTTQLPCAHRRPIRPVKLRSRPTPNHRPPESDMPITNDGRDLIRINLSLTFYWPGRRAVHKHACKQKKRKISTANQNNREKKHNQKNINGIIWFFFYSLLIPCCCCWYCCVPCWLVVCSQTKPILDYKKNVC